MSKSIKISSIGLIIAGISMSLGGLAGVMFTFKQVAKENITTTKDSAIPSTPVRGPLTLKAQADVIRVHTFSRTDGKTFAEMPRQIPKLDANGAEVLGEDGKPVMVANTTRELWFNATALITALNLGIISYAFSGFVFFLGLIIALIGRMFYVTNKR